MSNYIFSRWKSEVSNVDPSLKKYICLDAKIHLFNEGRQARKSFLKSKVHIVERLINTLMRGGTGRKIGGKVIRDRGGCGKKIKMYNAVKKAFEIIEQKTKKNPVEVLVKAIENSAPCEETTKVKYGGIIYHIPVDVAPQRRVDFAIRNIGKAVAIRSFDCKKTLEEALAEELILAAENNAQSFAIARKNEVERIAASAR
ncbi:MAG: 30S ribosomal protein S7 [archaeon]